MCIQILKNLFIFMDDFDLLHIFPGKISVCDNIDKVRSVQYFCNLAYSDVLNPAKNIKFPGTLVVSLSRKDLSTYFYGIPSEHLDYDKTHIFPWLQELKRPIPTLRHVFTRQSRNESTMIRKKMNIPPIKFLDYGDHLDKRFLVEECITNIDDT